MLKGSKVNHKYLQTSEPCVIHIVCKFGLKKCFAEILILSNFGISMYNGAAGVKNNNDKEKYLKASDRCQKSQKIELVLKTSMVDERSGITVWI